MGNICACCEIKEYEKVIIAIKGLKDDLEVILKEIIPNYQSTTPFPSFSEYSLKYKNFEFLIHAHVVSEKNKKLILIHDIVEAACIYSINVDAKESIECAKTGLENNENKRKIVILLYRGTYLDSPEIVEINVLAKKSTEREVHDLRFDESRIKLGIKETLEKIYQGLVTE